MLPRATLESSCVSLLKLGNDYRCLCGMMKATRLPKKASARLMRGSAVWSL